MAKAKMTLIGLDKFTNGSIWNEFKLPEGIDEQIAKNEILMQCGEFPILYATPDFITPAIGHFCKKWEHNFERWYKAEIMDYEALFNLDVKATYTDDTIESGSTGSRANTVDQVSAYDSNDFKNASQNTTNVSGTNNAENHNVKTEFRQGNQGVTMTQEMLLAELNVRRWNLYQHIADIFATEFCISIY